VFGYGASTSDDGPGESVAKSIALLASTASEFMKCKPVTPMTPASHATPAAVPQSQN
jgi:hypothetical protein